MVELGVAGLLSLGPTLAALAAWRRVRKVDHAVNSRPSEPSLYELVAETRGDVRYLCRLVDNHEGRLERLELG